MKILYLFLSVVIAGSGVLCSMDKTQPKLTNEEQEHINLKLQEVLTSRTEKDRFGKLQELIAQGADVNYIDTISFQGLGTLLERVPLMVIDFESEQAPKIVELLLQSGANPNLEVYSANVHKFSYVFDFFIADYLAAEFRLENSPLSLTDPAKVSSMNRTFKLMILFGGKPRWWADTQDYLELLAHVFPQRLLQAIAIGDGKLIREILAVTPFKVTDNDGISALVYAAGQGNIPVLSVLLDHPAYSLDTTAIEQALEIVASRLKGLKPESLEYQQYKEIFDGLESHLSETLRKQIQALVDQAIEKNPALTGIDMPEEIQQQIFMEMLGNQDIFKRLFGPTS